MNDAAANVPIATVGSPRSSRQSVSRLTKRRDAISLVEIPRLRRASARSRPSLRSAWVAGSGREVGSDTLINVFYGRQYVKRMSYMADLKRESIPK